MGRNQGTNMSSGTSEQDCLRAEEYIAAQEAEDIRHQRTEDQVTYTKHTPWPTYT